MKSIGQMAFFFITLLLVSSVFAASTLTYDYDANGNLVRGEGKYYEYNDANHLAKVRQKDENGPVIAEYFYDYNGQRVKKVENGITTYYIGKHFEKQIAGDSQTNTSYYFANGERVAKKDPSVQLSFYHSDHLGGTNAVTDASGSLVERTKYYPFGEIREGGSERYSYTGKEKDKLTDWYYYEARYYNPQFKHFTQADMVESDVYDPQELNRYAYVQSNPVNYIDPTGHWTLWNPFSWFKSDKQSNNSKAVNSNNKPNQNNHNEAVVKLIDWTLKAVKHTAAKSVGKSGEVIMGVYKADTNVNNSVKSGNTNPKYAPDRKVVESLANVGSVVTPSGKMGAKNNSGVQNGLNAIFTLEDRYKKMELETGVKMNKWYAE